MEFTQLRYFQAVAKLGNVSRAAQALYVTQPNLSKSIARLEDELGVPLFDHRKGKILLNDYGRVFLTSVELSFSELATGVQTIRRLYACSQNILSLGCSVDDFLPDVLKEFSLLHPQIGIRQFGCPPAELAARLHDRTLDLAVTTQPPEDELLTFELLGQKEFVILVGQDHPLAGRNSVAIRELADARFICDRSRMDAETLNRICRQQGFHPHISFEVENTDLIYRLLGAGAGIAFMPMAQITKPERDYPQADIHLLRLEDELPPATLGLLYHKDYVFSTAGELLRDFLRQWILREDDRLRELGHIPPAT